MEKNSEENLVRQFDSASPSIPWKKILPVLALVVLLGLGTGLVIAKGTATTISSTSEIKTPSQADKGQSFGSNDTSTFKDTAEGVLKEGGIEGEGQFHLERPGGETQFVYMTSSTVDLSLLKGRKVKVWGQTQKAQYAGWLMDVGRVEVLE